MISLKFLCDYYFKCFSEKNIEKLNELFSDDIILKDWNIYAKDKENVIREIKEIFDNVKTIKVMPINYHEEHNTVCCEIEIIINEKEILEVIDVITFNELMKIEKIKAYKI